MSIDCIAANPRIGWRDINQSPDQIERICNEVLISAFSIRAAGLPKQLAAVLLALSALFVPCMGALADELPGKSPAVASVNGQIITAAELDAAVSSALRGSMTPVERLQIRNQALNELINQYLVAQQLESSHQEDNPELLTQFEQLKRQAKANFYINERLQALPGLHSGAVDRFIRANPDFFLKRRTYHYT